MARPRSTLHVGDIGELLQTIAAGFPRGTAEGEVLCEMTGWDHDDSRVIVCTYHPDCPEDEVSISTKDIEFRDPRVIYPFLERLIKEGVPFVTRMCESGVPFIYLWTIRTP